MKISSSTMAKMTNEEMVAISILEKICAELECNIGDIMEFTKNETAGSTVMQEDTDAADLQMNFRNRGTV